MINYSLNLQVEPFRDKINFDDRIALIGSCFTEHIGNRLGDFKFETFINPAGIVFNPISLAEPLKRMVRAEKYSQEDLILHDKKWASLHHHGKFSSDTMADCLRNINEKQSQFEDFISSADWLVVTLGTAWVYEYSNLKIIVANCHKIPQAQFNKRLLDVNEIVEEWKPLIKILKGLNSKLKIIFTVSPVKHLRDGVHENNLNKATLLLAIHKLCGNGVYYFPAYELVTDDLRDYRFFEADGAHPNEMAINYVFDKFRQSVLSDQCNSTLSELDKYFKLKNHRPLHETVENQSMIAVKLEAMKRELVAKNSRLKELFF